MKKIFLLFMVVTALVYAHNASAESLPSECKNMRTGFTDYILDQVAVKNLSDKVITGVQLNYKHKQPTCINISQQTETRHKVIDLEEKHRTTLYPINIEPLGKFEPCAPDKCKKLYIGNKIQLGTWNSQKPETFPLIESVDIEFHDADCKIGSKPTVNAAYYKDPKNKDLCVVRTDGPFRPTQNKFVHLLVNPDFKAEQVDQLEYSGCIKYLDGKRECPTK